MKKINNKFNILIIIIMILISIGYAIFSKAIYNFVDEYVNIDNNFQENNYIYGEADELDNHIKLKILTDPSGRVKEVEVVEYRPRLDEAEWTLQKLIANSIDKYESSEISGTYEGFDELIVAYKKAFDNALGIKQVVNDNQINRVSLQDAEILEQVTRNEVPVTRYSIKTGFGAYIINNFTNADRNKNGNLSTHEYLCAVNVDSNGRILNCKFDHITSNISFTNDGKVPTGNARAYKYESDKNDPGFNGYCNDGHYINMIDFEKTCISLRLMSEIEKRYKDRQGYQLFVKALQNAYTNAKYYGANKDDTLGLASYKELNKKNIIDANGKNNGYVMFETTYMAITTNKDLTITSCIADMSENDVTITKDGNILGSGQSQSYTICELSNSDKYSRVESKYVPIRKQLNDLALRITGGFVQDLINEFSENTNNRGLAKPDGNLYDFVDIDFIKIIETMSNSFLDSRKIQS